MSIKDYYNILGVKEEASPDEIKKAYRQAAKKWHPDANPGNKQAEEKFKGISEAYDILKDPQKRSRYDQMRKFGAGGGPGFDYNSFDFGRYSAPGGQGQPRPGGSVFDGFDVFGNLGDLFAQFFDRGERIRQERYGPQRGQDIAVEVTIPFELASSGGKSSFEVDQEKVCPSCRGGGAKPGSQVQTCQECGGRGTITFSQGGFGVSRPCPKCLGRGQIISNPCDRCGGKGQVHGKRTYTVKLKAGIEDGTQIRLKGQGEPGMAGGPVGDMVVTVRVESHAFFRREGNNVSCSVTLTLEQAASGVAVKVKTPDGKRVRLKIPPQTRTGTRFRLPGMGLGLNGKRGDQYVTVNILIPAHPTPKEKEWIDRLVR